MFRRFGISMTSALAFLCGTWLWSWGERCGVEGVSPQQETQLVGGQPGTCWSDCLPNTKSTNACTDLFVAPACPGGLCFNAGICSTNSWCDDPAIDQTCQKSSFGRICKTLPNHTCQACFCACDTIKLTCSVYDTTPGKNPWCGPAPQCGSVTACKF
jgi:hypothetical protein